MLDNFREWLSDNLRYILLGLAILVVLLVLFFGVRAVTGLVTSKEKGNTTEKTQVVDSKNDNTEAKDESKNNDKKEETSSLEKNAYPEVNSLINSFYEAWGRKDIEQMKQLTDNLDAADEAKVTNSTYIESYNDITVYTKPGLTDDSYVVYASYKLKFTDIKTEAPGLSQLYVMKNEDGSYIIHNDSSDEKINAYLQKVTQDEDVQKLVSQVEDNLNSAIESDEDLKAFEEQLGQDSNSSARAEEGATLTVQEDCNFRAEADTEAEILDVIPGGTEVTKVADGPEGWIEVEYNNEKGFVSQDLLR